MQWGGSGYIPPSAQTPRPWRLKKSFWCLLFFFTLSTSTPQFYLPSLFVLFISFILSAFCLLFYFFLTSFLYQLLFIISFFFLVRVCSTERPRHDMINGPWAKAVCSLFRIHNIRKLLQLNKVHIVKYAITKIIIYTLVCSSCCNLLLQSKKKVISQWQGFYPLPSTHQARLQGDDRCIKIINYDNYQIALLY